MNIMGFKTEINYILKSSDAEESKLLDVPPGEIIKIKKNGIRTYVMNASILYADSDWRVLGMCVITESQTKCYRGQEVTVEITAKVVTRFTPEETEIVSRLVLAAEKARETLKI